MAYKYLIGILFSLALVPSCFGNEIHDIIEGITSNFNEPEHSTLNQTSISHVVTSRINEYQRKSRVSEGIRQEVEEQLPSLLEEGFKTAESILLKEKESVRRSRAMGLKAPRAVRYRSRTKGLSSKRRSACRSLGLLQTSKIIAERFNIPKEEVGDFLRSIKVPEGVYLRNPELCDLNTTTLTTRQGGPMDCDYNNPYRSIDGTCNNPLKGHERTGSTGSLFKRVTYNAYDDGLNSMRGEGRSSANALPNPRAVSAALSNLMDPGVKKEEYLTQMFKAFGQFMDHDLALTAETTAGDVDRDGEVDPIPCCDSGRDPVTTEDCRPIDVSRDSTFSSRGITCLRFVRSLAAGPEYSLSTREHVNEITSYMDGSNVYGSTIEHAARLRTYSEGKLKVTTPGEDGQTPAFPYLPSDPQSPHNLFKAGDIRVNEQPGLSAMHTIFVRLHNKYATGFASVYAQASDEEIYQKSRRIVVAVIQHIAYNEFIPLLVGLPVSRHVGLLPMDAGYMDATKQDFKIPVGIYTEFSTAVYRFGHTLIGPLIKGFKEDKPLETVFFNNKFMTENEEMSPSNVIHGECDQKAERIDPVLVKAVTDFLFATAENGFLDGSDLMALNIQRGRDHGIPTYNKIRKFCNFPTFASFGDMRGHLKSQAVDVFELLYTHVDEVDLFPAGLAENLISGGRIGPTFACILILQFYELKYADRFFYESSTQPKPFSENQLASIRSEGMASVLCATTSLKEYQVLPFIRGGITGNPSTKCEELIKGAVSENLLQFWQL